MKSGSYIDNEIIRLREFYRKAMKEYDIETEAVPIQDQWVRFLPVKLINEQVGILLPATFIEMPEEIVRLKYVSDYRPSMIATSRGYEEDIGLHLLDRSGRDLDEGIRQMEEAVTQTAAESVVYNKGIIESEQLEGRWFEYKNFTLTNETYNIQFLLGNEQKLLVGTFNCPMEFYDEWKPYIFQVMERITIEQEGVCKE